MALEWFRDYLTERKQFVNINGHDSDLKLISCGVPQGSLLGPLLFILYINDLQNSSQILSFICFADDSNVFFSHRNDLQNSSQILSFICFADDSNVFFSHRDPQTLINIMSNEFKLVQSWIHANKLSLNIKKPQQILCYSVIP